MMRKLIVVILLLLVGFSVHADWLNAKGFNFRETSGFGPGDGTNETYDIGAAYPRSVTIDGDTFDVGWDASMAANTRDRDAAGDRRLAGIAFRGNSVAGVNTWRLNLPAAGQYYIRLAFGDNDNARTIHARLLDNTTALATWSGVTTNAADAYMDSSGTVRTTEANWVSGNVETLFTFSTTTLFIEIGDSTGAGSDITALAHFSIRSAGSSSGGLLLRRRRAANDDTFDQPLRVAAGF